MNRKLLITLAAAGLLAACGDDDDEEQQQSTLTCENYCTTVKAACTGANEQFNFVGGPQDCTAYCNAVGYTAGSTATEANTLGCRTQHATLASQANPEVHCWHAGPAGGDLCGDYCETYCELALEACTGANQIFATPAACATACAGIPVAAGLNVKTGANLQCRIWHLATARMTNPQIHCFHGRPDSINPGGAPGSGPCN
jgi:hypothetical protein